MQIIEQENHKVPSTLSSLNKLRISSSENNDNSFFDDYSFAIGFGMNRNNPTLAYGTGKDDNFYPDYNNSATSTNSSTNRDGWVIIDDPPEKSGKSTSNNNYGKQQTGNINTNYNYV